VSAGLSVGVKIRKGVIFIFIDRSVISFGGSPVTTSAPQVLVGHAFKKLRPVTWLVCWTCVGGQIVYVGCYIRTGARKAK